MTPFFNGFIVGLLLGACLGMVLMSILKIGKGESCERWKE
jgi:hypothetical protein